MSREYKEALQAKFPQLNFFTGSEHRGYVEGSLIEFQLLDQGWDNYQVWAYRNGVWILPQDTYVKGIVGIVEIMERIVSMK